MCHIRFGLLDTTYLFHEIEVNHECAKEFAVKKDSNLLDLEGPDEIIKIIRTIVDLQIQRPDDLLDDLPGNSKIFLGWAVIKIFSQAKLVAFNCAATVGNGLDPFQAHKVLTSRRV